MLNVKTVADRLAKSETEVLEQSLRGYLLREMGLIEAELRRYRERYNVVDAQELRLLIEVGTIPTHPAWEDYLEWINGLEAVADLHELLRSAER
jgi:hypothetical protein